MVGWNLWETWERQFINKKAQQIQVGWKWEPRMEICSLEVDEAARGGPTIFW